MNSHVSAPKTAKFIHMIDSSVGWVLCADGSVLHTTDGGLNWIDETPAALLALKQEHQEAGSLFADGSTAWIVVTATINTTSANNLQPFVFRTSDAGQTWQEGILPQNESNATVAPLYQIANVSAQEAWILDTHGEGASASSGERSVAVGLYQTTDGGKTWVQAQNLPAIQQYNNAPAISFANQQTGIITGSSLVAQNLLPTVYLTQDGGTSWQSIPVQSPDPAQWKLNAPLSPQFLTPNDGVFIAPFQNAEGQGVEGPPRL